MCKTTGVVLLSVTVQQLNQKCNLLYGFIFIARSVFRASRANIHHTPQSSIYKITDDGNLRCDE